MKPKTNDMAQNNPAIFCLYDYESKTFSERIKTGFCLIRRRADSTPDFAASGREYQIFSEHS